jgi:hypothetical protein
VFITLENGTKDPDSFIRTMARPMLEKFNKYWHMSQTIFAFAVVLDPRYKMKGIRFTYERMYGKLSEEAVMMVTSTKQR